MRLLCFHQRRKYRSQLWWTTVFVVSILCFCLLALSELGTYDVPTIILHHHRHLLSETEMNATMDDSGFSILDSIDGTGCSNSMPRAAAIVVWILLTLWMFLAIAVVCDDFFVASLEVISEVLNLSEDVAGATFMAAGICSRIVYVGGRGFFCA